MTTTTTEATKKTEAQAVTEPAALPRPRDLLPHGPGFTFVDRILSFDPSGKVRASRVVPLDEPWTHDHFPKRPIVPGVIILEGMTQAGGVLLRLMFPSPGGKRQGVLAAVKSARFHVAITPGSELVYEVELLGCAGKVYALSARTYVGELLCAEAEIRVSIPENPPVV
jgi:3-hydroxyacyl-[acyl-carrier-protein] dehydratase